MIALYSFEGEQSTDLPFEKNELLEVIGKPQEGWWQARNALGNTGLVPTNYLVKPLWSALAGWISSFFCFWFFVHGNCWYMVILSCVALFAVVVAEAWISVPLCHMLLVASSMLPTLIYCSLWLSFDGLHHRTGALCWLALCTSY